VAGEPQVCAAKVRSPRDIIVKTPRGTSCDMSGTASTERERKRFTIDGSTRLSTTASVAACGRRLEKASVAIDRVLIGMVNPRAMPGGAPGSCIAASCSAAPPGSGR